MQVIQTSKPNKVNQISEADEKKLDSLMLQCGYKKKGYVAGNDIKTGLFISALCYSRCYNFQEHLLYFNRTKKAPTKVSQVIWKIFQGLQDWTKHEKEAAVEKALKENCNWD